MSQSRPQSITDMINSLQGRTPYEGVLLRKTAEAALNVKSLEETYELVKDTKYEPKSLVASIERAKKALTRIVRDHAYYVDNNL